MSNYSHVWYYISMAFWTSNIENEASQRRRRQADNAQLRPRHTLSATNRALANERRDCLYNCHHGLAIRLQHRTQGTPVPILPLLHTRRCHQVRKRLVFTVIEGVRQWKTSLLIGLMCSRAFLKRAYPTMKKNNPSVPILIREALDVEPRVFARYGTSHAWNDA